MTTVQFDRDKLRAAILHICSACPADQLGAVKFHKVLYFVDMLSYAFTRRPLTGATYRKRPYGPTCVQLLPMLAELQRDGLIAVAEVDYHGYRKKEYRALAASMAGVLADDELALLDDVIAFVCANNTASTISEFSHQKPWHSVEFGDEISYSTAYQLIPSMVTQEALDAVTKGMSEIEEARQKGDALDFVEFRDFRNRVQKEDRAL